MNGRRRKTRTMSRFVVFDIGNVLLAFQPLSYLMRFFDEDTAREVKRIVFSPEVFGVYEKGIYTREDLIAIQCAHYPKLKDEITFAANHWGEMNEPIGESWKNVLKLKEEGYALYLLSNMGKDWKEMLWTDYPEFEQFDGAVFSFEIGVNKPDIRIYRRLLEKYHLRAADGIFVDDRQENVAAAVSLGMRGVVFREGWEVALGLPD